MKRTRLRFLALVVPALLAQACRLTVGTGTGTTYYVSPAGGDTNSGVAIDRAWKTIDRANRQSFKPGDRLLLEGGRAFDGNLLLDAGDAGVPDLPVIVGSYGSGRATIQAGMGYAVLVRNAGNVEVRDLICIGEDRTRNHGAGVAFINTLPGDTRLKKVRIHNIEAKGFGRELTVKGAYPEGHQLPQGAGILVAGYASDRSKSGFEDVEITGCSAHDNAYYGILITGYWADRPTRYANAKVRIADCRVYDNPGDPLYHENHSGSGILVEDCDGGLVERCVAYGNGALCDDAPGGPCGIWTAVANRVTIQFCESHSNRTGTAADGDGFDLDGGCTGCVLQYNYSHDNDGALSGSLPIPGSTLQHRGAQPETCRDSQHSPLSGRRRGRLRSMARSTCSRFASIRDLVTSPAGLSREFLRRELVLHESERGKGAEMVFTRLKDRLWLFNAIVATALWGVWGAFMEIPEKSGFPATLGYCVWALTLSPVAAVALKLSGWKLETDSRSASLGTLAGLLGAGGQLILFETLRLGPAYLVFPVISLYPALAVVLSLLFLKERASRRASIGIALALLAIYGVIPHPVLIAGMVSAGIAMYLLAG